MGQIWRVFASNSSEFVFLDKRFSMMDYHMQDEILKLRQSSLKKEDIEVTAEMEKLERERNLHIREMKRLQNEDSSR